MEEKISILHVGHFYKGGTAEERYIDISEKIITKKFNLYNYFPLWKRTSASIWTRLNFGPPFNKLLHDLKKEVKINSFKIILIEKNLYLDASNWKEILNIRSVKILLFNHDTIQIKKNCNSRFINSIPLYSCVLTTKKQDLEKYKLYGAKEIRLIRNAVSNHNLIKSFSEYKSHNNYIYDVGFIGRWEFNREKLICDLASKLKISFVVAGPGWERSRLNSKSNVKVLKAVWGDDYFGLLSQIKINLGLLSKIAKDNETTRLVEIPASGNFMVTEYNENNEILFKNIKDFCLFRNENDLIVLITKLLKDYDFLNYLKKKQKECIIKAKMSWKDQLVPILEDYLN